MHTPHFGYSVMWTDSDLPELAKQGHFAVITLGQIQSPIAECACIS